MIQALLLAAGASRRFGSNKLVAALPDGTPVVVAAARALLGAGTPVLAVLRPGDEETAAVLRAVPGVARTLCPDAGLGLGHSLAWGVARSPDARGWLVALGDMPFVQSRTVEALVRVLAGGASIVAPILSERRGHPVGFSRAWREGLLSLRGDTGGAGLIAANPGALTLVPCDDSGVLRDLDRPGDLAG